MAFGWHRVFHPLCGADPATLAGLVLREGLPAPRGLAAFAIAVASSLGRLPFTLAERAWVAATPGPDLAARPPVFIVGHMRSGTTHLHNLLAASGQFATVPPVLAGMPWEALGLGRIMRPFIDPYLPETRFMDAVRVQPDSPTEDEVALANMGGLSYYHALYFPRRFARTYARGLLLDGCSQAELEGRRRTLARYVDKMARRGGGRPLLLKNPAYTAQIARILELWPQAHIIHIHRDPCAVFASTRRALAAVLGELSLQSHAHVDIDAVVLDLYPRMMARLLKDMRALPPEQAVHVGFAELERAPMAELARIWRALDLGDFTAAEPRIAAYRASIADYRKGDAALSDADTARVSQAWEPCFARLGYRAPGASPATAVKQCEGCPNAEDLPNIIR